LSTPNPTRIFTFNFQNWQLAASLEIIQKELIIGNSVHWYDFAGEFRDKYEFPLADRLHFFLVRFRMKKRKLSEKLSSNTPGSLIYLRNKEKLFFEIEHEVEKLAEEVAYLELISKLKESEPSTADNRGHLIEYKESFLRTYYATKKILDNSSTSKVFLYNGRFLQERAVWAVCSRLGIQVFFYEKCNTKWDDRYLIFDEPIHNPIYRSFIMEKFGNDYMKSNADFPSIAKDWFAKRFSGESQNFTRLQKKGSGLEEQKPYFVFFHSSEDELITTDLVSKNWGKQHNALFKLVKNLSHFSNIRLIIRAHPNLAYKSVKERGVWNKIGTDLEKQFEWITFLPPESSIDSYELILQSEGVITVGSTIGVEAAFLGKKSILLGRAFHECMNITLNPENDDELCEFLFEKTSQEITNSRRVSSMKYAVFHALGGNQFLHVRFSKTRNRSYYEFSDFKIFYPVICSIALRFDSAIKSMRNSFQSKK